MIIRGSTTMKKPLAVLITAFSLSLGLTPAFTGISGNLIIEAEAHQGRTDANGGHDIMIIKTKAVLEAITITAEAILLISIQTGSALMQAVLLVIPAQLVVLPPKIRLLPEIKIKQKQQPLRFLLVGRKMIMAGGTAFLQIPTMLTV